RLALADRDALLELGDLALELADLAHAREQARRRVAAPAADEAARREHVALRRHEGGGQAPAAVDVEHLAQALHEVDAGEAPARERLGTGPRPHAVEPRRAGRHDA